MRNVITVRGKLLDGMPSLHETRPNTAGNEGRAAEHSTNIRPGWHVRASDLHPGDVVQQCDWPLHVREVMLSQAAVVVAVTEFEFPLHYAADEQVQLAA